MNVKINRIKRIEEMLLQKPDDSFLNYALAMEYMGNSEWNVAETLLLKVIRLDPNYVASYYQLAQVYEQLSRRDEAISTYKKGIEIAQNLRDMHTLSELRSALNALLFDDE